ncbi:MAG TPA: hypothetical protein VK729_15325 [Silvibacterium sp.]|jgi:hypothetical protein|nr:hypothetical protein [Silvibacterium sp.]
MKMIAKFRLQAVFLAAFGFLFSSHCFAQASFVDGPPGRQETWGGIQLHACPPAFAMQGAHVRDNRFTCLRVIPEGKEGDVHSIIDSGTQGNLGNGNMHVCPTGMYMRGLRSDQNRLLCSSSPDVLLGDTFLNLRGSTQGNNMHICPNRNGHPLIMSGIHTGRNDFACTVWKNK